MVHSRPKKILNRVIHCEQGVPKGQQIVAKMIAQVILVGYFSELEVASYEVGALLTTWDGYWVHFHPNLGLAWTIFDQRKSPTEPFIENRGPVWVPQMIKNGAQSEIHLKSQNRALAAARARSRRVRGGQKGLNWKFS